ncbi:MAG: amidohydrolase/deacetylase family metallohydrolase [Balneolaceae bacterium]|nr:amidohydrolase/deacetylase family metallohydrolase [Balneolaceae bacterium]
MTCSLFKVHFKQTASLFITLILLLPSLLFAQNYDLLLKDGHVIDSRNEIDGVFDIAISGNTIARVAANIPENEAKKVVDASGLYITPGLIDMHSHNFYGTEPYRAYSDGFNALPPDGFTFRSGVTTVVDVGGAGWRNFQQFKDQVIDRSQTRVLAFINIVGDGMSGAPEQNLADMDPRMTSIIANQHSEIVGVKIAHYNGRDWEPYRRTVTAAEKSNIPVMVDFGGAIPPLPIDSLVNDILRPGDIYTHVYGGGVEVRQAVIDENDQLRDGMLEAQENGIIFDVGHGGGSFFYSVAVPAIEQGLWPNTISTDIHIGSMNGGMKNMANLMSKFMNLGMTLNEVIEASTWKPAQVIQREELGHLSEGAVADIAVFSLQEGDFGFIDSRGFSLPGSQKLQPELTIRAGSVVWDLNGLAATPFEE